MSMPELVSILIPAYNEQKWIGDTVKSALAQSWPNKEIVIVNDGSTDDTLRVAKSFESKFVRVVTQENSGASAARNRALSFAQGDYIQWLDADDLLAPDKLSQQLREAGDGATSRVLLSSAYGEFFVRPHRAKFTPHALWQDLEPTQFLINKFTQNVWLVPAVWLVSRRLTDLAGLWDERLSLDDDGEYFSRVVAACERVRFVPEARVYYRCANVGSLSRSASDRACESLLLSLSLCIGHLRSLEDSDRTRAAGVRLLQSWLDLGECFYPDREELLHRVYALARELGGNLRPRRLSWKYLPIKALFGWKAARRMRTIVSNVKLLGRVHCDRLQLSARK
jgi:glycosyltransferase involved in cell wall biosynthesis